MTNKQFISRCEIILVSLKERKNCHSVQTKEITKWIGSTEVSAGNTIRQMCRLGFLKKIGAASKTCYEFSDRCNNDLLAAINEYNDTNKAAEYVVHKYLQRKSNPTSDPDIPANKIKIDPRRKQAIGFLMDLIHEYEDLKAEVELLREENAKLREFRNQITNFAQKIHL